MSDKRPRMKKPAAVSDLLTAILRGTPAEGRLKEGRIWIVWDEVVGSRIASHAQPAAFRDGTVTVTVDSAPWMQQLNFLKRDIVSKINDALGYDLVKDLYFKAGNIATATPAGTAPAKIRRTLTDEEKKWVDEQAANVADPDLQAVLASLLKRDLENKG